MNNMYSGEEIVIKLSELIVRFSKLVKTEAEAERKKLSSLAAEVSQMSTRFLTQAQFIANPSVTSRPENPCPLMVMALAGLLAGLLIAVFPWRGATRKMVFQTEETRAA